MSSRVSIERHEEHGVRIPQFTLGQKTLTALVGLGMAVIGIDRIWTSYLTAKLAEAKRATQVEEVHAAVFTLNTGLAAKVNALEHEVTRLQAGQSTEYNSRTEADAAQQKLISELKTKLDTRNQ